MNFLKICIFLALLTLFKIVSAEDKYIAKVAVVDIESILEKSLAIIGIRKSMNQLSQDIESDILQQEKELNGYEIKILNLQKKLSQEQFDSSVAKFNRNVSNTKKKIELRKLALEQSYAQAVETVYQKIIYIISELANEYHLNIVLPSSRVLYITNNLNITFEVISKLNQSLKEVSINNPKNLKELKKSE